MKFKSYKGFYPKQGVCIGLKYGYWFEASCKIEGETWYWEDFIPFTPRVSMKEINKKLKACPTRARKAFSLLKEQKKKSVIY